MLATMKAISFFKCLIPFNGHSLSISMSDLKFVLSFCIWIYINWRLNCFGFFIHVKYRTCGNIQTRNKIIIISANHLNLLLVHRFSIGETFDYSTFHLYCRSLHFTWIIFWWFTTFPVKSKHCFQFKFTIMATTFYVIALKIFTNCYFCRG